MKAELEQRLHQWLDSDRERNTIIIRASDTELWHVLLVIGPKRVVAVDSTELEEALEVAMAGIVIPEPEQSA
jgi:hypothetical protein